MRTPAGSECSYFYGDYYRGREREECRLIGNDWRRELCLTCPVPGIQRANACDSLQLKPEITRPLTAAFQRRVKVTAFCTRTRKSGFDPHTGCGECHPLPPAFEIKK